MAKHHTYSIEFKRQVAQEYIAGETLHALAKRHDLSRNLIRIWVAKYEAGTFEDDASVGTLRTGSETGPLQSQFWPKRMIFRSRLYAVCALKMYVISTD